MSWLPGSYDHSLSPHWPISLLSEETEAHPASIVLPRQTQIFPTGIQSTAPPPAHTLGDQSNLNQ